MNSKPVDISLCTPTILINFHSNSEPDPKPIKVDENVVTAEVV